MSRRNFVQGAVILSAASLLCKALSAVFKIPLDRYFIGPEGIAIYQNANTIFNWVLAIAATGIPIAVSNLVADSDEEEAAGIRSSALWAVTAAATLCGALLFALAGPLARRIAGGGDGPAELAIRVMALGVPFMGVVSSYKGYFQGRGDMLPSAVSQIADSLCKVCAGLGICVLLLPKGLTVATAGAMSGVALGAAAGAAALLIMGRRSIKIYRRPSLSAAKRVILLSIPVTLGAAGFSCMMLTDNFTVQSTLVKMGISYSESYVMFGHLSRAFMIYNLPATLIAAVTMTVAPACAEDVHSGDRGLLRDHSLSSLRMLTLISMPCLMGCLAFSREILSLLYNDPSYNELLMFTGALMLIIPFTQVVSAVLQATGCVWKPIIVLGVTILLKLALNLTLIPSMGVNGAPFATVISYAVGGAAFIYLFRRHMGFGIPVGVFLRPLAAAIWGAALGRGAFALASRFLGEKPSFIAGAAVMAIVYFSAAVFFGAVKNIKR